MPSRNVLLWVMLLSPVALVGGIVTLFPYAEQTETFDRRTGTYRVVIRHYGVLTHDMSRRYFDIEPYGPLTAPSSTIVVYRYRQRFPFSGMKSVALTEDETRREGPYFFFYAAFNRLDDLQRTHPMPADTFAALVRQRVTIWNRLSDEEARTAAERMEQENAVLARQAAK